MEGKQSFLGISSLPRELMEQLQKFRQVSTRSREDSEVERCFPEIRSPFKSTDGNMFKFPRDYRENIETTIRNYIPSPKSNKTSCALYGENSDWMMAERTKSRTPPASPITPSSSNSAINFRYSPSVTKQQRVENKVADPGPNVAGDDEIIYCVPRSVVKSQKDCSTVEQTPTKQSYGSDVISPFRRSSPSPSHSEDMFRSRLSDTVDNGTFEERQTDRARKQLNFETCSMSKKSGTMEDLYYSSERSRSPCKQRREINEDEHEDHSTSRLVLQLLSQIKGQGRKRKASDCCSCECDTECDRESFKRQRNEFFPNQFRSENELNWRRVTEQPEVLPDSCTCALMEREFLKMAEHAYKNIRRQDGSPESFVRFQKELSETNAIINESLSVLKNMKNICEHRHLNKY
ncbi:uncharacterized protein LOC125662443 isoform X2 [Ostrea edulis]|uniref:uncharacterized protein LOC125662443 isoform X2 n=1 Tax=Ostrea edulis TaxID=37623 RepID=UPI0020947DD3|nr:uncharacterized protein LOC125662443 isoform X2 [Ostrea edulis]